MITMIRRLAVVAALALACVATPALARYRHQATSSVTEFCGARYGKCYNTAADLPQTFIRNGVAYEYDGKVIGSRPAGCPHRFCGCEASLYLFGSIRPELNLAWNWVRYFRRTAPAPRMAAARRGHVMVLISHVSGDEWLVHDGNSGGGKTREHVRSIRGYVIVDPSAARVAQR
jgi:hypothetical protein